VVQAGAGRRADRRIATYAFGVVGVTFAAVVVFAHTPPPHLPENDPKAAAAVVAYITAGEHASYVVAYDFTRTRADGSKLPSRSYEARTPDVFVTRLGDTLSAVGLGKSFECSNFNGESACHERAQNTTLPDSEVVRIAIGAAPYNVWRIADATIAGEHAKCYALHSPTGAKIPQLGIASELCFDAQGVALRRRIFGDVIDGWEATSVVHRFDPGSLRPVLVGFEAAAPKLGK
jgi:hypothetical protein